MSLATVFRFGVAAQAIALLAQALLAGLALSGSEAALAAHMPAGASTFLISAAQVVAVFLLRRSGQIPRWVVAASIGLLLAEGLQMLSGRLYVLALHLPLGAGLFGASIGLAISASTWRPAATPRRAGAPDAAFTQRGSQ